ncbi:MAG: hypothetical protein GX758_03495 [Tenericutes bacterium]|nr:hypothetical protein [Mycoplasmatota bacterium]
MKKIIIFIFLLIPCLVLAATDDCDYTKQVELGKLASNISYETSYNSSSKTFTVTFHNVNEGLYLIYKDHIYNGSSSSEVEIKNVPQGTSMKIPVKTTLISCDNSLLTIYINLQYYNPYYDTEECENYKSKLTVCSSQFLSYEINKDIFEGAIKNYEEKITNEQVAPPEEKKKTVMETLKEITINYGIKLGLVALGTAIAVVPARIIFRKIKHKI